MYACNHYKERNYVSVVISCDGISSQSYRELQYDKTLAVLDTVSSSSSCARSLQTQATMALRSSLSSFLLMSSLLGYSFLVTKLFRLSVYFVRCLPLLLISQIFPLNNCLSSPSALFIRPKNCSCLFSNGFEKGSFVCGHFHYFFV